jgi:hypothetical protein
MVDFISENTENTDSSRAESKKRDLSPGYREKYPEQNPVLSPFYRLRLIVSLFQEALY